MINQDVQQKALQEAQKRLQMLQFLRKAAGCLGQGSLGLFFLTAFNAYLLRSEHPYLEEATLTFYDDHIELKVNIPIHKEDFKTFDFVPSMAQLMILQFAQPKVKVESKDELVRLIATAEALILKKVYPELQVELTEEDVEKAYSCWPWLRRNVQGILDLIKIKINRECDKKNNEKKRKRCKIIKKLLEEAESNAEGSEGKGSE